MHPNAILHYFSLVVINTVIYIHSCILYNYWLQDYYWLQDIILKNTNFLNPNLILIYFIIVNFI